MTLLKTVLFHPIHKIVYTLHGDIRNVHNSRDVTEKEMQLKHVGIVVCVQYV